MKKPDDFKKKSQQRIVELITEFIEEDPDRTQQSFADACGVSKYSLSQYVNGTNSPGNISAAKIASRFDVNPLWVMGFDVDRASDAARFAAYADAFNKARLGLSPAKTTTYPVLGKVACGEPMLVAEERAVYASSNPIKADAVVVARGDSMIGARIYDGDVVFIRYQETVENGEIAVVIVEDEGTHDADVTLKRYYRYGDDLIVLRPENTSYEDLVFKGEAINRLRIIGKAVAFQSDL